MTGKLAAVTADLTAEEERGQRNEERSVRRIAELEAALAASEAALRGIWAPTSSAPPPRSSTFRCRLETASDQNLNDVLGAAGDLLLVVDADGFKVISQEVFSDSNQTTVAICAWDFASVEEWEVVPEPTGGESHSFRLVVADPVPLQVQFRTHADIPAQRVEDDIETFVYEQDRAASPIPMAQRVYERGKKVSRKVSLIQESEGTGMTPRNRKMKVLRKVN